MDILELTRLLVGVDSQNPGAFEPEITHLIARWAGEAGYEVTWLEPVPGRPNLVITLDRGAGPHVALSGHTDTKPIGDALHLWQTPPLELTVRGDRAYGLGATDMKGAVAAMMLALDRLAEDPNTPSGRTSLILTADEEQGSDAGAKALVQHGLLPEVDAIVIGEPSGVDEPWEAVHLVSRGICCFEIDIHTAQGHSGLSQRFGRNASLVAADLLHAFEDFRPTVATPGDVPCQPTVNPGIFLQSGVSYGTWPGYCKVGMEIRLVPGMTRPELDAEVRALVEKAIGSSATWELRYLTNAQGWMAPVAISAKAPIAVACQRAAERVLGRAVPFAAFAGGTDATSFLGAAGIPTVTSLGPGWISVAHGANESVGVDQLGQAVDIYAALVGEYAELVKEEREGTR